MNVSLTQQLHALMGALVLGLITGAWYDLLRGIRRRVRSVVVIAVLDLLFWLCATAALFLWSLHAGDGKVQVAVCAAVVVGGAVYFRRLSRFCYPPLSALGGLLLLPCFSLIKLKNFFIKFCKKHFSFGGK